MSRTLETEANEARRLLDAVYGVWMSDNTGNDFIDALDPVMHEVAQFCRANSNAAGQGRREATYPEPACSQGGCQ